MTTLSRDCSALAISNTRRERCGDCGSPRQVHHAALHTLSIAHVDCAPFMPPSRSANGPDLAHRPVIIGGGSGGVVLGLLLHRAPLWSALGNADVQGAGRSPRCGRDSAGHGEYREVGSAVRTEMMRLTPLGDQSVRFGRGLPTAGNTSRHFGARKGGDRMSGCDQQFGFASGSISSS